MRRVSRITIISLVVVLCLPIAALAAEKCWQTNTGSRVHVFLTQVGTQEWAATGYVDNAQDPTLDIPVTGTAIKRGSSVTVSLALLRAGSTINSVTWQFNLTTPGLNGSGYWRWFDGSAEAAYTSVTNVACTFEGEAGPEDPGPLGIR